MSDDLLARARAALEGVSPGPWEMRDGYVYPLSISARLGGVWPADAEFIAASRQLVPELLAEVERLTLDAEIFYGRGYEAAVKQGRKNREASDARLAALEQAVTRVRDVIETDSSATALRVLRALDEVTE